MKTLRHVTGVLLASIGTIFILGAIGTIFDRDPDIPLSASAIFCSLLGFLLLGGAYFLLRPTVFAPTQPCPNCGGAKRQELVALKSFNNLWLMHFGGVLLSSLWGASRQTQFRCADCDTRYASHTRGARIAGLIFWVIFLMFLIVVVIGILTGAQL